MTPRAPCANINPSSYQVIIGIAGGPPHVSLASCDLLLPNLPIKSGHIMPNFRHNLMRIGKLCDHNCRVLFKKTFVIFFPRIILSSSVVDKNQLVPSSGASLFALNLIPPFQHNGTLPPRLSIPMISPLLEHSSVTSMLPPASSKFHLARCYPF